MDDNDLNREIAITLLEDEGFIVEYAVDGQQAVDALRAPLFYAYNLGNCWELRISVRKDVALEQFG